MVLDSHLAIRVLIVDDNQMTVENVKRLLDFEQGIRVVGVAANGRDGVAKAQEVKPDVVLMDINMPDMDGIEACRQMAQAAPRSRVMMMSVQSDMAYLKQAMNAGAREFLIKPFDYDELVNAVRRVHQADPSPVELAARAVPEVDEKEAKEVKATALGRGIAVAVLGAKGGVGCSTIAASLAVALHNSRDKARVLLVDGDLVFGTLDALLDLQPVHRVVDVLQKFDPDDPELLRRLLAPHPSGIYLLAAPVRPELAELVRPEIMLPLLDTLIRIHDYVVVDLGSRHTEMADRVLDLADRVILVMTPELTALKNANLLFTTPHLRHFGPEKVIALLNQYSHTWGISPDAVSKAIGRPVNLTIPVDRTAAVAAVNRGEPVVLAAPRSPMVKPILALEDLVPDAGEMANELAELERQKRAGAPPPLTPLLSQDDLVRAFELDERRGCARWIPWLRRSRA